jgi:F0F1-type ATP synthase assembly protein I
LLMLNKFDRASPVGLLVGLIMAFMLTIRAVFQQCLGC